jgi:MOSC domain-containing protein YiiM
MQPMVISVNTSPAVPVELGGEIVTTGICKRPVAGAVWMDTDGLAGDGVGDHRHHGGPDQAVYACAAEHYDYWRSVLNRSDLAYGLFGENLTVRGWLDERVCIGDTFRVGGTVVRVTGPRIPCGTLEKRVGVRGFAKRYTESRRFGMYLRVLEPGEVCAGDTVELMEKSPAGFGLIELAELFLFRPKDVEAMRRALDVDGLGERARKVFEDRIKAAED